jgi:mRNA-degrading endonuclease RelE of RelBE toxin-antitoxin system
VTDIIIKQMPSFKRVYKKLHKELKVMVNEAILDIVNNTTIGEEKKGDLTGVFVYKFKMHNQEFLLPYEREPLNRLLLALGVHENFYRDLKKIS